MGNSHNNKPNQEFKATCHPGLTQAIYQPKQKMFILHIKAQEGMEPWKKDLDRLLRAKHLFLPHGYSNQQKLKEDGCCMQQQNSIVDSQVLYLPFFYTLEKEIKTRKHKNSLFRQVQLWKLIGYMCKAVGQWMEVYPQQKLGAICPGNIVINPSGQVKLITKLSFFLQVFGTFNQYYTPPESRGSSLIKYALNPYRDPRAIQASLVFSIGSVILEAATLTLVQFDQFTREQKQQTFKGLNYSVELKDTVMSMVEPNQMSRIGVRELLGRVKGYRHKQ